MALTPKQQFRAALQDDWGKVYDALMDLVDAGYKPAILHAAKLIFDMFSEDDVPRAPDAKLNLKKLTDEQLRALEAALPEAVADARADGSGDFEEKSH